MTLLDYPSKVACTVFFGGCDLRCPFCHNYELTDGTLKPLMDDIELLEFLKKRQTILDGVCLTGGEPLLQPKLGDLIADIHSLGYKIKLDTNGTHPNELLKLIETGMIDYVAMDIKNSPEKYPITTGLQEIDIDKILKSIDILINGTIDYEFRTTVVREYHDEASFKSISKLIKGAKRYFLQSFTQRDTVPDKSLTSPTKEELEKYLQILSSDITDVSIRGV